MLGQPSAEQLNAEPSAECDPVPNFKMFREGEQDKTLMEEFWWSTLSIDSVCLEPESGEISQVSWILTSKSVEINLPLP